jgi:hypothetical protein
MTRIRSTRISSPALFLLVACATGCRDKPAPTLSADPAGPLAAPSSSASAGSAAVSPSSSGGERSAPVEVPTLVPERFAPKGGAPTALYRIDGALAVSADQRVGRIVGEGIEWLSTKIPKGGPALGDNIISGVYGRWPDRIDVTYTSGNGRAPMPAYMPLTGKGDPYSVDDGGSLVRVTGMVTLGESTLVASSGFMSGDKLTTVRGPRLGRRHLTPKQAHCDEDEVPTLNGAAGAIPYAAVGATPEGTLMAVGRLCGKRAPAAEIWDKEGKPRIVDLGAWIKDVGYAPSFVQGRGDELWFVPGEGGAILHYQDGKFEPLPSFGRAEVAFTSSSGKLHASDGLTIQRFEDGAWTPIGRFTFPMVYTRSMALEEGVLWASAMGVVSRLRQVPSTELGEGCATPFVSLYDVAVDNAKDFTFPTTRKALSTFPDAADLGLVEFYDEGRRLGVTVKSKAQAEALVAHVKATMKDEHPRALCYAPKEPRKIDISPQGK